MADYPPAFPTLGNVAHNSDWQTDDGMTLRDWFASMAPTPEDSLIHSHQQADRSRNPHNDSYKPKLRSRAEIVAMLAYEYADAMLAERERGQ